MYFDSVSNLFNIPGINEEVGHLIDVWEQSDGVIEFPSTEVQRVEDVGDGVADKCEADAQRHSFRHLPETFLARLDRRRMLRPGWRRSISLKLYSP